MQVKGFNLIELMVSMLLSIFLIGMMVHIFVGVSQQLRYQHGLMRIHENIQSAHLLLGNRIRMAGYYGCNRLQAESSLMNHTNDTLSTLGISRNHPIKPVSATQLANLPQYGKRVLPRLKPGTDLLWVTFLDPIYQIAHYELGHGGYLSLDQRPQFDEKDIIVISDCENTDVLSVRDKIIHKKNKFYIPIHSKMPSNLLSKLYPANAFIGRLRSEIIYIGKTQRENNRKKPIYALYVTEFNGRTIELIEGVEDLKIEFSNKENRAKYYAAKDWRDGDIIKNVRFNLHFNSVEEVLTHPPQKNNQKNDELPDDCRLHHRSIQTWAIRAI